MSKLDHFAATELKTEELETVSGGFFWCGPPPRCPPKPRCDPPKHCQPRRWC